MGRLPPTRCRACSMRISRRQSRTRFVLGLTEEIPYLKKQERLTFARCGITDPLSLSDYISARRISRPASGRLSMTPEAIVEEVTNSGLARARRRGFPTGIKWQTVLKTASRPEIHRLQRGRRR